MSTQTRSRVIPLTRWERKLLRSARDIGVSAWGGVNIAATYANVAKGMAGLSDNERQHLFYLLEAHVDLTRAIRGEN